jgi:hypothetical protein
MHLTKYTGERTHRKTDKFIEVEIVKHHKCEYPEKTQSEGKRA